ncbi:hypothetical protein P4C99_14830 [Pontiellaceae bacterium B1224]|nr:hypothetical protein [Pontiellaceae bacterium B1224]
MSDHLDYGRIAILFELGKFNEAELYLRKILTNNPANACALSLLGRALAAGVLLKSLKGL